MVVMGMVKRRNITTEDTEIYTEGQGVFYNYLKLFYSPCIPRFFLRVSRGKITENTGIMFTMME